MDQQNLPGSVKTHVTLGEWIVTLIITAIPLVGLIMLFVWAFGDGTNPSKKTWAQAYLIMMLIAIVLVIIFFAVFASILSNMFGSMNTYS
jgi:membrane-associated HD superfamily phosphohydrolase